LLKSRWNGRGTTNQCDLAPAIAPYQQHWFPFF
jgi:hypothetical protein